LFSRWRLVPLQTLRLSAKYPLMPRLYLGFYAVIVASMVFGSIHR